MVGWNLKQGDLKFTENDDLFSIISNALLSQKYKTTTYKYCFFLAILQSNINFHHDFKIPFVELNEIFAKCYWDLIVVHKIPQKYESLADAGSSMEILLKKITSDKPYVDGVLFDSLKEEDRKIIIKETLKIFTSYVIGAFYANTSGKLFAFNKKEKIIQLNKQISDFLLEYKIILEQLCYFQWLKMCESILKRRNSSKENLSLIIENITRRQDLMSFKKILNKLKDSNECFYCGKKHSSNFALDHVIPWDFLKTDNIWNLVWCCPKCNSSKNNRIPSHEFIDKLINRNKTLNINMPDINKMVDIAIKNGIEEGWKPK